MDFLRLNKLAFHLLVGLILTAIYPMQTLFSGNQNIYFLWGMAEMLPDAFVADPLLLSPDPYPLFSWLISILPVQLLSVWTSVIYVLLNAIYSFALFGIADQITSLYGRRKRFFSFSALFLFLHSSPVWGTYFKLLSDVDLRWIWDSGIAEQGVLRGYLQPSAFGVFLLLSFYQAVRRNWGLAILCIAPAAMIHANYLFLGGLLTIIYLIQARFEKKSIIAAITLLVSVLPCAMYLSNHFVLLDEGLKSSINEAVTAGYADNLHLNAANWLSWKFYLQLTLIVSGGTIIWNTRFKNSFFSILSTAVLLSAMAYAFASTTLISLNPWRLSIILVPICSTVVLSKLLAGGLWEQLRPFIFGVVASICLALVYHRLMGNSSEEFLSHWWMVHALSLVVFCAGSVILCRNERISKTIEPLIIVALVIVGLTDVYVEGISKLNAHQFKAIEEIGNEVDSNTVYIVPPDWTSFRMNARKAVFVDENLIYGPALPGIVTRLDLVSNAYVSGDLESVLDQIGQEHHVKLITNAPLYPEVNSRPDYRTVVLR
jgi:hypothetical protein